MIYGKKGCGGVTKTARSAAKCSMLGSKTMARVYLSH